MYEVIPNLYLGNASDAARAYKMGLLYLVVNVTQEVPFTTLPSQHTLRIPVLDDEKTESMVIMEQHIVDAVEAIDAALQQDEMVLVHCQAGQQRSATVIAAYLMLCRGVGKEEAVRMIQKAYPLAFSGGIHFDYVLNRLRNKPIYVGSNQKEETH